MWLPTHTYKCTSDTRLSLASLKPVPSEAQTSAHPLIPPTLPISATPNFCVCSPSVCFSTLLSLSLSVFAGACGFHQLFGNYVTRVSQLQGEPLTRPHWPAYLWWCMWGIWMDF